MAHLPVPKGFQVAVRGNFGDDLDVLNVFHGVANVDGPYSAIDLHEVAQGFFNTFVSVFLTEMSSQFTAQSATAKDLTTVLGNTATFVPSSPTAGTKSAPAAPANVALVISWKEGISYRGGHPRTYLSAIPNDEFSDPQHIAGADAANIQTKANTFMSDINALTGTSLMFPVIFSVVHYTLHKVLQTPPRTQAILSALVNTRLDSQRRRLQS